MQYFMAVQHDGSPLPTGEGLYRERWFRPDTPG